MTLPKNEHFMKKILIVNNNMHIGGVQKALVSLLWAIRDRYDITLLLFHRGGEYQKDIPPEIKVITPDSSYRYLGMTKYDTLSLRHKLGRGVYAGITKLFGRSFAISLMALGQKKLEGYDAAISYLHNGGEKLFYGGCNDFVLRHVTAEKKITFLHCDYTLCGANTPKNAKQYAAFDQIAACSEGCGNKFLQIHPQLAEKLLVVPNCHRFDDILQKAQSAPQKLMEDRIHVVTVARLGKEKGVERALRAIAGLGEERNKLHYYVVGDGICMPLLQQIIKEENLEDTVTLCGMQENPYGYMQAADLLLIPSYSEAAPLVIGEAASLGTPVLSTETSSAKEMIEKPGLGWGCEKSEEGIRDGLQKLLYRPDVLKNTLIKMDNDKALSQFTKLI